MARISSKDGKDRFKARSTELVELISTALPGDGVQEVMPGLFLSRLATLSTSPSLIQRPAFCLVAQGGKSAMLGDEIHSYDPGHYLIYTVDLPLTFQVDEATEEKPYLGMRLLLEPSVVASVMAEADIKFRKGDAAAKAMGVNPVDDELMDVVVRLVRLSKIPRDQKLLFPLIQKEMIYRLLLGNQGARLGHMISQGDTHRISKAIGQLRQNFDKPLQIDQLARELGMSVSGFHHHFRSVTAMSPLQYHKQIRLQEARRLMLTESLDAATAGFRVGYEDPAYFSRDYKKQFGDPPRRDLARLTNNA